MNIDMHVHTTFSDGDYTPSQIVQTAKEKGLKLIAITDHDECRGYEEIAGADTGIIVCPGIEIAAKYEGEVHILGFNIDWRSKALLKHVESVVLHRKFRAENMIKKLNSAGFDVTIDDVNTESTGKVIGRPHIAAALIKKGYVSSYKEAFKRFLSKHSPYYVPYEKIGLQDAAQLIIEAKGKAVLAHPGLVKEKTLESLFPKLKGMGFWGIEAYHTVHSYGQCREFESTARRYGLFVTAGSDFHGSAKPDVELGGEKRGGEYLERSIEALGFNI